MQIINNHSRLYGEIYMKPIIKKAVKQLKNPYWMAKNRYIKYFDKLPIDNKAVLIESQHGDEFNGNVFYIVKYLASCEKYRDFTIYLSCKLGKKNLFKQKLDAYSIQNVKLAILSSDEYFRAMASAKYLINDNTFLPFYQKKEGQVYINTWHGTPLKSLGRKIKNDASNIGNPQKNFVMADWLVYPNEYTMKHMVEDYMIGNIAKGKIIYSGYPRNEIFFDKNRRSELRTKLGLDNKRVYAYMPTFRGTAKTGVSSKSDSYMLYYLYELDKHLENNEVLYLNLHPVSKSLVDFDEFEHIKPFPEKLDIYDFLNIADCLVSDYSSVFFDFACTGRKIILFTFDKEDYLRDRGVYIPLSSLPYPQPNNHLELLEELRKDKDYDDSDFVKTFCSYDSINATSQLCDRLILGEETGLKTADIPSNGKENVLIYAGNLAPNGVTASLRNLLNTVDTDKRNYYISFSQKAVEPYADNLLTFPDNTFYYSIIGGHNLTLRDRIIKVLFRFKILNVKSYLKLNGKRVKQNFEKDFGLAGFDTYIQFSGYVPDAILKFAQTDKNNIIYVHSDMLKEIKNRGNQRKDVLHYAYRNYDKVAVVTDDIFTSASKISKKNDNIFVAKNAIPDKLILKKSLQDAKLDKDTESSYELGEAMNFLNDKSTKKIITVGRFSPEKGHERLVDAFGEFSKNHDDARLVIMGGSSFKNEYEKLLEHIESKNLSSKVLLLKKVSNPFAIIRLCDCFILSSYYEGFGLVLAEADIVGLPIVSTDITGPRGFMQKNHGVLVDNSQQGIEKGLEMLYNGEVKKLSVDYDQYNDEVVEHFERLMK